MREPEGCAKQRKLPTFPKSQNLRFGTLRCVLEHAIFVFIAFTAFPLQVPGYSLSPDGSPRTFGQENADD